ncbi:hypothetical protein [Agarivorans sp. DSG3-1]|uniref:hypothetical protein n=1 Tax=Agarivorans sp. DSG3-1 TaxID=3342249 RepID=UPI00398EC569
MKHYRDITSFHSIGKAIGNKPESTKNVVDLLNFLSQVVFCETITVSILGPESITSGTIEVIEKLEALGLPKGVVERYSYPLGSERILQRNRIADQLKYDWLIHFPELGEASRDSFPSGYFDMLNNSVDIFSDTLLSDVSLTRHSSEIEESLNDDTISYMVGLMLCDSQLTELIRHNFKKQNVGKKQLLHFIALARNKYNLLLAEDLKLVFTPSASRAQGNRNTAYSFMDTYRNKLNKDPYQEMEELKLSGKQYELDIPSALHLLLADDVKSAEDLIVRAVKIREKVSWYRDEVLCDFNDLRFSNSDSDKIRLSNNLDDAYKDIASILSLTNGNGAKRLFGRFTVDFTDFTSAQGSLKAVGEFIKATRNIRKFKKNPECYLLTQELIHYLSKDKSEHKQIIDRLFIKLGGDFKALLN